MGISKITYAGHSAVLIQADDVTLAIDPWLQSNPSCPTELKQPSQIDIIALTHGHSDHAGEALTLAKRLGSKIVATYELAMILISEGLPESQVFAMNKGGSLQLGQLKLSLTHAMHSNSYDSAKGTLYAGEACGIVISDGKRSIYHAGDTALFSDMSLIKEFYAPEIALLPIGDRFTMGPREAAYAAKLVGCKVAIPIHYKTFDLLTGTADEFVRKCSHYSVETRVLRAGESFATN